MAVRPEINVRSLQGAIQRSDQFEMTRLLDARVDPDVQNWFGASLLHFASHSPVCTEALLVRGANPNIQDSIGRTPLMLATTEVMVRMLLDHRADCNVQAEDGGTALLEMSRPGRTEFISLLLAAKADPNLQNNKGETSLLRLIDLGQEAEILRLLNRGADVTLADVTGRSPIDAALSHKDRPSIIHLVRRWLDEQTLTKAAK